MSEQTRNERYNSEAWAPKALDYDALGSDLLRTHLELTRDHEELPPIHIPVERDGVVA